MSLSDAGIHPARPRTAALYRAAWRWHFYAGIFVIPFFLVLSVTGLMMLWITHLDGRDGERITVLAEGVPLAVSVQAEAAVAAVPEGKLIQYVAPRADDLAAIFRVDGADGAVMVAVDPYRAEVLEQFPRRTGWYDWADQIHGELKLGVIGDRMVETAASLGVVLLATGLYMWWPRQGGMARALVPRLSAGGRNLWKSLHGTVGIWISVVLMFFLISGLSWSGVWGEKMVQAWSSFPAGKYGNVPLSDDIHAKMNHGPKEVPWGLEQTPMPASGSHAGHHAMDMPEVDIDSVDALAREIGYDGRYQLNLPMDAQGVWTLSRDSMSSDSADPTSDRVVHVDQFTGKILADIRYADYSPMAKAMALGVALHMGTLGLWSVLANTLVCLSVIFLCVSGAVMWWKRRPSRQLRLAAPPMPADLGLWKGAAITGLLIAIVFPMAGLAIGCAIALDLLVLSRVPALARVFG